MHRPAHDTLVKQVQDYTQIQLALLRLDLGDVGDPLSFWLQRSEVPLQPVTHARGGGRQRRPATLAATLGPRPALQTIARHQSSHAIKTDGLPIINQVFPHPVCTQHATAVLVQFTDAPEQALVVELTGAGQALAPS